MSTPSRCPDAQTLRDLLNDCLDAAQQDALGTHLEACASCREAFDQLTAESRIWNEARRLSSPGSDPDTEAYVPLGAAEADVDARIEARADHPSGLPFLDATDLPDRIGTFGPYEVIELIGRGGFGVVLKAFDPALHRVVGLKVLAPQLAAASAARRRFVREARAAASVAYEHVVTIHAVDEWNGWPYLVMQYVGGKSLQDRIDRNGPLELKEILRIGMQTAAGLAAAHAQGLVHRDIKPANILLENGVERVKLTDFGLARAVDDPSLTQAGTVAGTPQYMSPEQAKGEPIDPRADLFSLGCVMYAMATGQPPFRGSTTMSVLRKVCDDNPASVRASNSEIPLWLEQIIMKLLAKDPNRRYQTATEVSELLADHLSRLQQGLPIVASEFDIDLDSRVEPAKPMPFADALDVGPSKPVIKRRVKRWQIAAAAGLLAFVGIGVTDTLGVTQVADTIATVLRIKTPDGTLVIEADDPEVQVSIDNGNVLVSGGGVKEVKLTPGQHRLQPIRDGKPGPIEMVTVTKGGKQTWSARFVPDEHTANQAAATIMLADDWAPRLNLLRQRYDQFGQQQIEANAQLAQLTTAVNRAKAMASHARALLDSKQVTLDRLEVMHKAGTVSQNELLRARSEFIDAQAEARIAVQSAQIAKDRFKATTASLQQAEAGQNFVRFLMRTPDAPGPQQAPDVASYINTIRQSAQVRGELERQAAEQELRIADMVRTWKQESLALAEELAKQAQAMHEAGVLAVGELQETSERMIRAKAALSEAEAALNTAKQRVESAKQRAEAQTNDIETELKSLVPSHSQHSATVHANKVTVFRSGPGSEIEQLEEQIAEIEKGLSKLSRAAVNPSGDASYQAGMDRLRSLKQLLQKQLEAQKGNTVHVATPVIPEAPLPPSIPPGDDDALHQELPVPPVVPRGSEDELPQRTSWVEESAAGRWHFDSISAFREAQSDKRPVLIAFWSNDQSCDELLEQFNKKNAKEQLKNVVCARIYVDRIPLMQNAMPVDVNKRCAAENRERLKELSGDTETPFFVLFSAHGKLLVKSKSPASLDELTGLLQHALVRAKTDPTAFADAQPKCIEEARATFLNHFLGWFW